MNASCTASSASVESESIRLASASIFGKWRSMSCAAAARSPRPTRATSSASGSIIIPDQSVPVLAMHSTRATPVSVVQRLVDQAQKFRAFGDRRCPQTLEVVGETNVGVELNFAVLVKMQKGSAAPIEITARLFLQSLALANLLEQRFDPVERGGACVLHV